MNILGTIILLCGILAKLIQRLFSTFLYVTEATSSVLIRELGSSLLYGAGTTIN